MPGPAGDTDTKFTKAATAGPAGMPHPLGLPPCAVKSVGLLPATTKERADPGTSAVNRYLQSWDVPNVFVIGASAFPQNGGYNPTGTVGALTFWALEAIKNRYLKQPGPLG